MQQIQMIKFQNIYAEFYKFIKIQLPNQTSPPITIDNAFKCIKLENPMDVIQFLQSKFPNKPMGLKNMLLSMDLWTSGKVLTVFVRKNQHEIIFVTILLFCSFYVYRKKNTNL